MWCGGVGGGVNQLLFRHVRLKRGGRASLNRTSPLFGGGVGGTTHVFAECNYHPAPLVLDVAKTRAG